MHREVIYRGLSFLPSMKTSIIGTGCGDLITGITLALADSGGIEEESSILHVPCFTQRGNMEGVETITVGSKVIVEVEPDVVLRKEKELRENKALEEKIRELEVVFGDGNASGKMTEILKKTSIKRR